MLRRCPEAYDPKPDLPAGFGLSPAHQHRRRQSQEEPDHTWQAVRTGKTLMEKH